MGSEACVFQKVLGRSETQPTSFGHHKDKRQICVIKYVSH